MDTSFTAVEQYLHEHIPISKAMVVSVTSKDCWLEGFKVNMLH